MQNAENILFTITMIGYFGAMILYFLFVGIRKEQLAKAAKNGLTANDISKILYVDLTRPELDISVVRVIIPEMEIYAIDPSRAGYRFLKVR